MERLSDRAIEIINELHTERLDYNSEYLPLINAANKLDELETILEGHDLERMLELERADREGRCVALPVKEGDNVYCIHEKMDLSSGKRYNSISEYTVDFVEPHPKMVGCGGFVYVFSDFGKSIFKNKEEAESALKAMKEREDDDRA